MSYKRSNIANLEELFHLSKDDTVFGMFGLIRYKSNDFSGNSSGNSEIYAVLFVILDISLMSHIRVTRE